MKKYIAIITLVATGLVALATDVHASLWDLYQSKGLSLPSVEERIELAEECEIENYTGTYGQNVDLEICLKTVDYWVDRVRNNENDPMTQEELEQVPERAWELTVPQLVQVIAPAPDDGEQIGFGGLEVLREFTCLADECDPYLEDNQPLGFSVVTRYKTTLSSSMTSNQATVPVSSFNTFDGYALTTSDIQPAAFLTIEPGGSREEIAKCTAISSPNFSTCTRGLAFYGTSEASVAANRKAHNAGSIVVMSNVHYVYEQLADKDSTESIGGLKTFTSGTLYLLNTTFGIRSNGANLQWSDDGFVSSYNFASSAVSQLTASTTAGIGIESSRIYVKASSTKGLVFDDSGNLYQAVSSTGGIESNANGLYLDTSDEQTWTGGQTFGSVTTTGNLNVDGSLVVNGTSTLATTTINGQNINNLLDGSNADSLHVHNYSQLATSSPGATGISNTTDLTTIVTTTLPGGTLGSTNGIRITIPVKRNRTVASAGQILTIHVRINGSEIASHAIGYGAGGQTTDTNGEITALILANGSESAQYGTLNIQLNQEAAQTQEDDAQVHGWADGSLAIDTSSDFTVSVTAQWSNADANNVFTLANPIIEILKYQ